ncbi:UDP-N-acetylmuramate dehydrogenase [Aidingimonas halophila]|uniref:UDP-N-acetylenolpyruvoylglucosamine reductase n=1 Tax=Aidingimonas halophila TaxID=574349 RepID=A0A1H2QNP1_9GAMM|nr:UDP-N-acetylmuramate dehydrogenase [Aidingimonas halophila]GHC20472.1 UDP-N-acetylenolpyruvoylglucosamine reductase [Aidingimonas halophila]SDW08786.1 UDP-N-acetylmuramate dehydrogenase [Aidingimonas halophila]
MRLDWQRDRDLSNANTLGLPCRAEHYLLARTPEMLRQACRLARQEGWPLTLLGGGSNLILGPFLAGAVVRPTFSQWQVEAIDDESVRVHVDAGMNWHRLVMSLAEQDLWGVENLALIPGHCGAAPIQNIGAYGVELSDILERVQVYFPESDDFSSLSASDCAFGYRDSIFKRELAGRAFITGLVLRLSRRPRPRLTYGDLADRVGPEPTAKAIAEAVCQVRREKLPDPSDLCNAGSFFKNPIVSRDHAQSLLKSDPGMPCFPQPDGSVKLAAGWLIDQCGLKGKRHGAFGVHERQALVLVHYGGGTARELLSFAQDIAGRVAERFGVVLEREPRAIGIE